MPLLSQLRLPRLSPDVLEFFRVNAIHTAEDLVIADVYALPGLAGDGKECSSRQEAIVAVLEHLKDVHFSRGLIDGNALLQASVQSIYFSSGCERIDDLLGGGVKSGTLIEFVGTSASGKTQLCLQIAAAAAFKNRVAVAFVDTANSFSAQRVAQMICGLVGTEEKLQEVEADIPRAMKSIVRMRAYDIHSLLYLLDEICRRKTLAMQPTDYFKQLRLLIVDSASAIVAPVLGSGQSQGHLLMQTLSRRLKSLAIEHDVAVLVTNHTVAGDADQPKPALGETWKSVPQVRLSLNKNPSSNVSSAALLTPSLLNMKQSVMVRISRMGVVNALDDELRHA
eukprot:SM000212S06924  [mRNA]  locus=s212:217456:220037:- [translate_table: standard]